MNWVGGSRNRLVLKDDAKKQREYFEKKKLQQRLKKLGVSLPHSPSGKTGAGSTDLMTLFIVNQISAKKAKKDPPKVSVFGTSKTKQRRNETIVLPMSPGSPSQLTFVESQSQCSNQEVIAGKSVTHTGFQGVKGLSPVLESAFSDYLPLTETTSPGSSSSSSMSSGRGIFPLQMNLQTESFSQSLPLPPAPLIWDQPSLQRSRQFQPFSQPRSMTDTVSWSSRSDPPILQSTPAPVRHFFETPSPVGNKAADSAAGRRAELFSSEASEVKELDYDQTLCADVFMRSESENKVPGFGSSKISLTSSGATHQTGSDQQNGLQFFKYTDLNSSLVSGCEYSLSCCCRENEPSSESDEGEEDCGAPTAHLDPPHAHPHTPRFIPRARAELEVLLPTERTAQSRPASSSSDSRDAGTQTDGGGYKPDTRDASTQCSSETLSPVCSPNGRSHPESDTEPPGKQKLPEEGLLTNKAASPPALAGPLGQEAEAPHGRASQQEQTLQEIADILLLLKRRRDK